MIAQGVGFDEIADVSRGFSYEELDAGERADTAPLSLGVSHDGLHEIVAGFIEGDDAVVYAYNTIDERFEKLTPIGCSSNPCAGHIGIVLEAEYYNDSGGWLILMRSANWYGRGWAVRSVPDANCSNVVDAYVFVPNGDKVSFWRRSR